MTHARKIEAYRELMAEKGIGSATAAPPLWELAWSLGIALPPPLFMGFVPLALLGGTVFGVVFGLIAWYMGNRGVRTMPLQEASVVALTSGAFFGITVAWFIRRLARKHQLGDWTTFGAGRLRT